MRHSLCLAVAQCDYDRLTGIYIEERNQHGRNDSGGGSPASPCQIRLPLLQSDIRLFLLTSFKTSLLRSYPTKPPLYALRVGACSEVVHGVCARIKTVIVLRAVAAYFQYAGTFENRNTVGYRGWDRCVFSRGCSHAHMAAIAPFASFTVLNADDTRIRASKCIF